MPISVNCVCGKVFRVKDEQAGQQVVCQVCGRTLVAPLADPAQPAAPVPLQRAEPRPAFSPAPVPATVPCPTCGESIPPNAPICPYCNETLTGRISKEAQQELIRDVIAKLDAHIENPIAQSEDRKLAAGDYSAKTIAGFVIAGLFVLLGLFGAIVATKDGSVAIIMGLFLAMIPGICAIVSLMNDSKANHILDAATPEKALQNYLMAIKTGRTPKAFIALVPSARTAGSVKTIEFKNKKIPVHKEAYFIRDLPTFKKYWQSVFRGPSMHNRNVIFKKFIPAGDAGPDTAIVEADVKVTSIPVLASMGALWILIFQKKEDLKIKKLLIKRSGNWYIAESQLIGPLDTFSK